MLLKPYLFIGFRYLQERKQRHFTSFIFMFAVVGMALGVGALIVVLSIMNGFGHEIQQRYLKILPQVNVNSIGLAQDWKQVTEQLSAIDELQAWSPAILSNAMIEVDNHSNQAIELVGIEPKQDSKVIDLSQHILYGSFDQLENYGIVLGEETARRARLNLGDQVKLILPRFNITPFGFFPVVKHMILVGIYRSDSNLDAKLAFIHLANGQKLLRKPVNQIRLKLNQGSDITEVMQQIDSKMTQLSPAIADTGVGRWKSTHWQSPMQSLFTAMAMEKKVTGVLLLVIVMMAAINIVTGLSMMVADKRTDIAVLRTLGASTTDVGKIFLTQGIILGLSGVLIGAIFGSALAVYTNDIMLFLQQNWDISAFDPSVFYVSVLPSMWQLNDFIVIVLGASIITILASIYPAWKATQISPVELLITAN